MQAMGLELLQSVGIVIVMTVVVLGMGAIFLGQLRTQPAVNNSTVVSAIIDAGLNALTTLGTWLGILIILVVLGVGIYILFRAFGGSLGGLSQ